MSKIPVATRIINLLEKGSMPKAGLIKIVQEGKVVTIQSVYKELRKLIKSGVVLLHGDNLSLSLMYVSKEYSRWVSAMGRYEGGRDLNNHFLNLNEGDYISMNFKSLGDLDAYWVHASHILDSIDNAVYPYSYSIIPHDWFFYGRHETDVFWTKSQKEKNRILVNGKYALDKEVAYQRIKDGYKISHGINPLKQNDNVYYTLINGYVLKISLDNKITKLLNDFIKNTKSIGQVDHATLNKIINIKCKCTMKISKDSARFEKLAGKCKKYFV